MNERVTVNGAVFFVGWRLTPYPTYGSCDLPLMSSPRWLKLPAYGQNLHSVPSTPFTSSLRFSPTGNDSFNAFHAGR